MTVLGEQLCLCIEKLEYVGAREVEVIRLQIDGMRLFIRQRIEGDGGKVRAELHKGFSSATTMPLN